MWLGTLKRPSEKKKQVWMRGETYSLIKEVQFSSIKLLGLIEKPDGRLYN